MYKYCTQLVLCRQRSEHPVFRAQKLVFDEILYFTLQQEATNKMTKGTPKFYCINPSHQVHILPVFVC